MPLSPKRARYALALALSSTLILAGCATIKTRIFGTELEPPPSVPCDALEYWRPSRADTDDTIRQAVEHNRIMDRFCSPSIAEN